MSSPAVSEAETKAVTAAETLESPALETPTPETSTPETPETTATPSSVGELETKTAIAEVPGIQESTTPKDKPTLGKNKEPKPKSRKGVKKTKKDAKKESESEESEEDEDEKEDEEPKVMKPEVMRLVSLFDSKTGRNITVEDDKDANNGDEWAYNAICVTNLLDWKGELIRRALEIKAPLLKEVLKNAIGDGYPGVSFKTARVVLNYPLRCMYHNLASIEAECARVEKTCSEEDKKFLDLLIQFLKGELAEDIANLNSLMPEGRVTYDLLWGVFRPGTILYTTVYGNQQAMLCKKTWEVRSCDDPHFIIECSYLNYNGYIFGTTVARLRINPFLGSVKISDLDHIPTGFYPGEAQLKKKLLARGKRFEELQGRVYMECKGTALGPIVEEERIFYSINGRVMIDCESFERLNTDRASIIIPLGTVVSDASDTDKRYNRYALDTYASMGLITDSRNTEQAGAEKQKRALMKPLTEEQYILCNSRVRGFALAQKHWAEFSIDDLTPIEWNDEAFGQLVLPAEQKELITALVESHTNGSDNFDDFIKGKGKGLIGVLHGPPGVGKTLTAESVAEHTRRPLYTITSGELGIVPEDLERNLSRILDVAAAWKAILLIDEADVFLEKRSVTHDITRNGLVSIFLRLLEYYQGIMFLTTNRITTFDEAFQTRIHLALRYSELNKSARMEVWRNFLERMPPAEIALDMEKDVDELAEREMNGRLIKNVIKTASNLARHKKEGMGMKHLLQVLKIQSEFEKDFRGSE